MAKKLVKKLFEIIKYCLLYSAIAGIKYYADLKSIIRQKIYKNREADWDSRVIEGYISKNLEEFSAPQNAKQLILMDCFPVPLWIAMNSILVNALSQKYNAKIVSYDQVSRRGTLNKIYNSFGCKEHIRVRLTLSQKIKHLKYFIKSIPRLMHKRDLFDWSIDGVRIGETIYESNLRDFSKPTPQSYSWSYYFSIFKGLTYFLFFSDFLNKNSVACAVLSHECYISTGILAKLCWSRDIPVFCANGVEIRRLKKHEDVSIQFRNYKNYFNMLTGEEKIIGEKWGKEELARIMSGQISANMSYVEKSAYGARQIASQLLGKEKIKVLIATHCFYDNPSAYTGMLFNDFYDWLSFLVEVSLETDYDWYIKPHRDYLPGTIETINRLIETNPKIKLVNPEVTWHQLRKEGLTHVLTCYGSVGHELPAINIAVINAGHNPHCSYRFNLHPRSQAEYHEFLTSLDDLGMIRDVEDIHSFYYVHYFLMKQGGFIFNTYEEYSAYIKEDVFSEKVLQKKIDSQAITVELNGFIESDCVSLAEYTLLKRLQ